MINLCKQRVIR